jgi:hypothetical protein
MFTVKAESEEDAYEVGYRAWRKEYAHSRITCVELVDSLANAEVRHGAKDADLD